MKKYKVKIEKPWIGYCGSTLQQSHGEQIKKGYLTWDIEDKNNWNVEFKKLINLAPFVTLNWLGTVEKTLKAFEDLHGSYAYMPGTRYRICTNVVIPQLYIKQLMDFLKIDKKAAEVTFKTDIITNMESITAHGLKLNKKSLTQDVDSVYKLYEKFIEAHQDIYNFDKEDLLKSQDIIKSYFSKLNIKNDNFFIETKNTNWTIKEFKFDNIFVYGPNNYINFNNLQNIVGIFGPNATGKSSIIGALVYTLFNTTDRGPIKNALIVNKNKKECFGSVRIGVDGSDYLIERRTIKNSKNDDEKSTTSVNLWLIENRNGQEVKVSKNGITRDDTDKIIRSLVGTADDFLLTALASQNDLHRFIDNKATKRKEILNRFLELDVFDKLYEYAKNDYSFLDNQTKNYSFKDFSKLNEKLEKEIDKLQKDISSFEERTIYLNDKKDSLNLWIKTNENKLKTSELNSIDNLQKNLNDLKNYLSKTESELEVCNNQIIEKRKIISFNRKEISKINLEKLKKELKVYENLKNIIDELQKTYDMQNVVLETQQKAITKLKVIPCGTQFPNCHYIKDAHEANNLIKNQTILVKNLYKTLEENKNLFNKYVSKNINKKISDHHDYSVNLDVVRHQYEAVINNKEHKTHLIKTIKKDIKELNDKIKNLETTSKLLDSEEYKKKKESLNLILEEINLLNSKKNENLILLGGKKDSLNNLINEQNQNKDLNKKLKLYESIQSAFSKNGIPVMILQNQLPAINREMSKVLDGLVDFTVFLETDITSNVMDIYLDDSIIKRPIELCS